MSNLIIFLALLIILLALRVPIYISLGVSAVVLLFVTTGTFMPELAVQKLYSGVDSFTLMAIPLFMLTGELMNFGGISRRLIDFANGIVGWIHGGLGFVVVLVCCFLAAILGSSSACSAIVGAILIPAMVSRGYDKNFSAGLVAASGGIGPIIPPSTTAIVYASVTGASVSSLFVGGYAPGIVLALAFMVYTYITAKVKGFPAEPKPTAKSLGKACLQAIIPLMLPVIIMGGIIGGFFTATEAGAVSVIYCLIISIFVYKEVKIKDIPMILLKAAKSACLVMAVIATSALLGYAMTVSKIPQAATSLITSITDSRIVFLLLVNVVLLIAGMFLDASCSVLIITPILMPCFAVYGVDMVFFGIMMTVNLMIGVLTPPVGMNLYVTSSISGISIIQMAKNVLPFIVIMLLLLLFMILCPNFVTFLPNLL